MSSHNFRCTAHAVPGQHIRHYSHGTSGNNEEAVIRVAVKRYTPLSNPNPRPGDLTILAGHAAGMPKEMYEPLWDKLLRLAQESGKFRIRSIWVIEAYNHGTSAQLNEGLLGDERKSSAPYPSPSVPRRFCGLCTKLTLKRQPHGTTRPGTCSPWSTASAPTCLSPSWVLATATRARSWPRSR